MQKLAGHNILVYVIACFVWHIYSDAGAIAFDCAKSRKDAPAAIARSDVYKDVPFGAGEKARYELRYFGTLVGYGFFEVRKPIKYDGVWHRSFHAEAKTGDWYKLIFIAHDKLNAISRPKDFGIRRFYMEQDEGKIFAKRFRQKKWLDFDHSKCKVVEKIEVAGKAKTEKTFDFMPGGIDTLAAMYRMRVLNFQIGKTEKIPVYSSEKNWWLEMTPVKEEKVKTPAGEYKAMKVRLKTFLGKDLQQKGDLFAWIDIESSHRPMVKIEGEIKIGRVVLNLVEFQPKRSK